MKRILLLATMLAALVGSGAAEKMTLAGYMGWYVPTQSGRGSVTPFDFSILPLELEGKANLSDEELSIQVHRKELTLLQKHGWNTVGADGLFYNHAALGKSADAHNIGRQLQLMDFMERAAKEIPDCKIQMVPFIEFLAAYRQLGHERSVEFFNANLDLMMSRFGNSPFWRKIDGRPVIYTYVTNYFPVDFWKKVIEHGKEKGHNPFWIMDLDGLAPALTGDFDLEKARPYLELFDGVYNFGCSGLEESATFPGKMRKLGKGLKAEQYLGATLWPGYLSDRPYNRNFISPEGTSFLRNVWEAGKSANPDFLHWVCNDYKEATTLLPSFSTLTSRLEIAERFLAEYDGHAIADAPPGIPQSVLSYRKALYPGEDLTLEFLPLPAPGTVSKGKLTLRLLDERGKELAAHTSPELDFTQMKPYHWKNAVRADRKRSRVIRVEAAVETPDGRKFSCRNLPDVAVVNMRQAADQLFYSVPLHRLSDRKITLTVNTRSENAAWHDGFRRVSWKADPEPEGTLYAVARSGHALKRMAAPATGGVLDVTPGQSNRPFRLFRQPEQRAVIDWQPTDGPNGEEYYQALAQFPDGTYAYSPTIWCRPYFQPDELWAQWIFAPGEQNAPVRIADRSGNGYDVVLDKAFSRWPFESLRQPETRALVFKGDLVLAPPPEAVPYGPMTLEVLFSADAPGKEKQYLAFQRGAQATLLIDEEGCLVAERLPEHRKHPDPHVRVRSKQTLKPGAIHHAAVTYDSRELRLYLDGELQDSAPCDGTRSSEGFFIGGLPEQRDALTGSDSGRFRGKLLRLSILGRPLSAKEVAELYRRGTQLGF